MAESLVFCGDCMDFLVELEDGSVDLFCCDPPYGRKIGNWVRKAYYSAMDEGATVVMLIPARTDTLWFHNFILGKAEIRFIKGRLLFSPNGDRNRRAPFPSMIVIFRDKK